MYRFACVAAFAACLGLPAQMRAQTILTYEETLARARAQGGPVVVARARIAEAEAELLDASARFRNNPLIETSVGPRTGNGARSTDIEVGLSQQFESGGQRSARIAGAHAAIERQQASVDDVRRTVVYEAALAFLDGIAALDRLRIAEEGDTVSRDLLNATERRYALGDIAAIDVNLARIDAARSAATLRAARTEFTSAVGRLRELLRLPAGEPIELRGSLDLAPPPPLDVLRASIEQRPDFAMLRAEARQGDADVQLGRALRKPDLGIRAAYEREESSNVVLGGLTITLPAFQRGQGTLAAGSARALRARLELDVARAAALTALETAYTVHQQQAALAATLAKEALPSVDDNQNLARRSYDAGELNLIDFLNIRRDALETRALTIDRRLNAARARVAVDNVAGVLR